MRHSHLDPQRGFAVAPHECLTGVRLSHTLGANMSSGSFAVEMGGQEWSAVYAAVAQRLGGCPTPAG